MRLGDTNEVPGTRTGVVHRSRRADDAVTCQRPSSKVTRVDRIRNVLSGCIWRARGSISSALSTRGGSCSRTVPQTTAYRVFPELWAVRSALLPRELLPPIQREERYSFAQG